MLSALTLLAALALAQSPPDFPLEENAPPEFPRTVRRGDQLCYQTIDANGQIQSACQPMPGVAPSPAAAPSEPAQRTFVASLGLLGGADLVVANGALFLPGIGVFAQAGGRVAPWVAIVGVVNATFGFLNGGALTIVNLAPGVRFGRQTSFTLSLGPSYVGLSSEAGSLGVLAGGLLGTGVFPVAGPFSLLAQLGVTFDASAANFNLGAGLGASF
ncbi:MAG: hypothetical protein AB1730_03210 [Myxococcota bacterium]